MISVLKSLASFLFFLIWAIILLEALILALIGGVYAIKVALEELFGCTFTMSTMVKNLFSQEQPKKSKES